MWQQVQLSQFTHGLSPPVNVVHSAGELHWPSLSTQHCKYLTIVTIYDILHCHISLPLFNYFMFSSSPTRSHSLSLQCRQLIINSVFCASTIILCHEILCVSSAFLNRHALYKFQCVYSEAMGLCSFWIVHIAF